MTNADPAETEAIRPSYNADTPSGQSALDVFKGHWKSRLPPAYGLSAGVQPMFEDTRVHWGAEQIPGGLRGKSVLELGPFEAYNTLHLQELGASEITAVEGNNINFLKCLVLKEVLGLRASLLHGDFCKYLAGTERRFDVIWASGVLYHQVEPLELLARIAAHADVAFFWTHYFDPSVLQTRHRPYFVPEREVTKSYGGYSCRHYHRSYNLPASNVPMYFEGGNAPHACWLGLEDIYGCLRHHGMTEFVIQYQGEMDELPLITFLARRPAAG